MSLLITSPFSLTLEVGALAVSLVDFVFVSSGELKVITRSEQSRHFGPKDLTHKIEEKEANTHDAVDMRKLKSFVVTFNLPIFMFCGYFYFYAMFHSHRYRILS